MKKVCILGLLASVIFSGCSATKQFKSQTTSIQLEGNPTTGYSWYYTVSNEGIINIEENIQYQGADGVVGAPSVFFYTINSLKPGTTELNFEYKRSWETVPPIKNCRYIFTVKEDGSLIKTECQNQEGV